uniref:Polynucleotide 5'-hydroxyl-kinase NOL9-like isoform X2 n=1 Tax=Tursiops truncatus TaxID=9739 RepID=A0A6J3QSE7_TURTR|nr:polynucleotide 5'-hydroxyl-kinase NOL9-like isoform X2 [Tursiops truncatus]
MVKSGRRRSAPSTASPCKRHAWRKDPASQPLLRIRISPRRRARRLAWRARCRKWAGPFSVEGGACRRRGGASCGDAADAAPARPQSGRPAPGPPRRPPRRPCQSAAAGGARLVLAAGEEAPAAHPRRSAPLFSARGHGPGSGVLPQRPRLRGRRDWQAQEGGAHHGHHRPGFEEASFCVVSCP